MALAFESFFSFVFDFTLSLSSLGILIRNRETRIPTTKANIPNNKYVLLGPTLASEEVTKGCKNILPRPLPAKAIPRALPLDASSNQLLIKRGTPIADIIAVPI